MKYIKYSLSLSLLLFVFLILTSCQFDDKNEDKLKVVTTIFPLYDFTREIVQDKVDVQLILPPGFEPHSYEPKPRGIFEIRNSDLFIYTGDFLEVWATKIINVLDEDNVMIIKSSEGVSLLSGEEEENLFHHHHTYDPHIWLDPNNAMIMVDNIVKGLIQVDPQNESFYRDNASNYKKQLQALDSAYQDLFSHVKHDTIIFGGHFIFGYLANQFNLEYQSPYNGFSPDTLPTPKKIQELINLIDSTGIKTIFYEELINPKVAKIISLETGAQMLPLNGAGNVSKEDFKQNVTYLSIMYHNIENFKKGLIYDE
ncbi:zinc ABC transporter substrate-binding protein [Mycoplasmatota bacterium]|nr:zinc ABC transporter substrate-binding protein [Mycoplasmatota bacterium]